MDPEGLDLLRKTIHHLLTSRSAQALPSALLESGWVELVANDGHSVIAALFEQQGQIRVASPSLDLIALAAFGLQPVADIAVVHPWIGQNDELHTGRLDGEVIEVDGLTLAGHERAAAFAVPTRAGTKMLVAFVDADVLERVTLAGFDPTLGLTRVHCTVHSTHSIALNKTIWHQYISSCRLALAHELLGVADALLQITVAHVRSRELFGTTLGSLQTVKHRIADTVVAISGARALLDSLSVEPTVLAGRVTKAAAGRAALLAARNAQQLCGALGWTEEHELLGAVRRANLLDALFVPTAALEVAIGTTMLNEGEVPRPFLIGSSSTRWDHGGH